MKRIYHICLVVGLIFIYFLFDSALREFMDFYLKGWLKDVVYALNMLTYVVLFSILFYKLVKPEISVTKAYILIIVYAVLWVILRFWIIKYVYGGY